ncbi:MAG: NADH-quinone oxidoreductase subunit J [Candidatus Omnitrophica bacterium]|nr:NADH-quinone oxidoreductase subunit J [Candidatus Omnitrophota bacterium]
MFAMSPGNPSIGPLDLAARAAFYGVACATLIGAAITVTARNLFRAALGLALALFGVAVLYLFLEAEFLAVSQLLIYVGAILTLIIFGVMLTAQIASPTQPRFNRQAGISLALALAVGLGLGWIFLTSGWPSPSPKEPPPAPVPLSALGRSLISIYLLPFELLSILLLGTLVGAIVIARKEKDPE